MHRYNNYCSVINMYCNNTAYKVTEKLNAKNAEFVESITVKTAVA